MSNSTYLSDNYTGVAQFLFVNHQEEKIGLLLSFVPLFLNLKFFLKKNVYQFMIIISHVDRIEVFRFKNFAHHWSTHVQTHSQAVMESISHVLDTQRCEPKILPSNTQSGLYSPDNHFWE